jgi:hypothetical protein
MVIGRSLNALGLVNGDILTAGYAAIRGVWQIVCHEQNGPREGLRCVFETMVHFYTVFQSKFKLSTSY